ncbi:unnamed protein product [Closterium sp. NIES-54]
MFITLYFIVTRLPDSLRSVKDHFLSLDPTSLTVDLLEQHLLAAETSAISTSLLLRTSGLLLLVRSTSAARSRVARVEEVAAGVVVGAAVEVVEAVEVVAVVGLGGGGGSGGGGGGSGGSGGSGGGGTGGSRTGARRGGFGGGQRQQQQRRSETQSPTQLHDAWHAEFGDEVERPHWLDLLRPGVAIFDLDFDVILSAMYALSVSAEGDCYRCVPPDLGIAAAALGASESGTLPGTAPAEALHTFTLDSGASRCFFHDSTTLTLLSAPVPVQLADPSGGPIVARSSTVLPCPTVPFGSLTRLHLPSFSTNLVSTAALQDSMVTTTTPGGQRVSICTCTRTGRHLATITHWPGSSLYTLATESPQVAASAQVYVSGQVAPPCSCRLLSHQTLLWHHHLGHPSLPRLRGIHSRLLVPGLPKSLLPLPPSPTPPSLPCVVRWKRAAPRSSFPPTTAPVQTLHMDVWGLSRIRRQGRELYFQLVVVDYMRYITVFPLRSKVEVPDVLIPWIRAIRLQLRDQFHQDLPLLRLHSDRGGEFSSNLLWEFDFSRGEGILHSFTLLDSPHQNGIAERRIGLVMEVAGTSMIHAAALHLLWPFASVPFYRLFPYRSAPLLPRPLFLAPGPPPVDPLYPQGPAPSGVSQVDPLLGTAPIEVAVGSGASRGAVSGGAASGGAKPGVAESEGAGSGGAELGGEEPGGA